jgi:hypothetical protein
MEPDPNSERMIEYLKEREASPGGALFPSFADWRKQKIKQELESGQGFVVPNFPEVTPGDEMAIVHKTCYDAYINQDFSPAQALYMTAALFTGNPGIAPDVDGDD